MNSSGTIFEPSSPDYNNSYSSSFTNVSSQPPIKVTTTPKISTLSREIIGAIAGGATAFVIILLIVALVAYCRYRRKRKKPPMLPPPNTRRFSSPREQSRISENTEPSGASSTKIVWIPQTPIIHSEDTSVNERPTSYVPMIPGYGANGSLSPEPSPRNRKPLPPPPCQPKSPPGYVNVTQPLVGVISPSSSEYNNNNVRKQGEINEGFDSSEFQNGNFDADNDSNGSYIWCDPFFQGQRQNGSLNAKNQTLSETSSRRSTLSSSNSESYYPNVSSLKNMDKAHFDKGGLLGKENEDINKSSEKLPLKYVNVEGFQKSPTTKHKINLNKSSPFAALTRDPESLSNLPKIDSDVKLIVTRTEEIEPPESPKNDYANFHLHLNTDLNINPALNIPVKADMTENLQFETGADNNSSSTKEVNTGSQTFLHSPEIETKVATQKKLHDAGLQEERSIYLNAHAVAASMPHLYGKTTHQNKTPTPPIINQKTKSRTDVTMAPKLTNAKLANKEKDMVVTPSPIKSDVTSQKNADKAGVIIAPKPIKKLAATKIDAIASPPPVFQKGAKEIDSRTPQPTNSHTNHHNPPRQPLLPSHFNSAPNVMTSPTNVLQNAISQLKKVHQESSAL